MALRGRAGRGGEGRGAWNTLWGHSNVADCSTQGVNTAGLEFDPDMVIRGLVVDKLLGNLVKVDRFGLVKRAMHGCAMMSPAEIHSVYGHECVNLRNEQR